MCPFFWNRHFFCLFAWIQKVFQVTCAIDVSTYCGFIVLIITTDVSVLFRLGSFQFVCLLFASLSLSFTKHTKTRKKTLIKKAKKKLNLWQNQVGSPQHAQYYRLVVTYTTCKFLWIETNVRIGKEIIFYFKLHRIQAKIVLISSICVCCVSNAHNFSCSLCGELNVHLFEVHFAMSFVSVFVDKPHWLVQWTEIVFETAVISLTCLFRCD